MSVYTTTDALVLGETTPTLTLGELTPMPVLGETTPILTVPGLDIDVGEAVICPTTSEVLATVADSKDATVRLPAIVLTVVTSPLIDS